MDDLKDREEALDILHETIGVAEYARQLAELRSGGGGSGGDPLVHFWCDAGDVQLLVVPGRPAHIFCIAELASSTLPTATAASDSAEQQRASASASASAAPAKGEHILLYLDVSASMNHDERGVYQAPKSPDHPASSIKKARDSFGAIVLSAVKRGGSVTIVPWSYKLLPAITFTPEGYMRGGADAGGAGVPELASDEEILADVRSRTSEAVFRASGGTSIEGALRDATTRCKELAPRSSGISLWLLTDGEETVYVDRSNSTALPIPTNVADPMYKFFTVRDARTGITAYQCLLAEDAHDMRRAVEALGCPFRFNVCFTGDAEPTFLAALRQATDGHFHVLTNLSSMADEMCAAATDVASRGTVTLAVDGVADELVLPAALHDEAICVRSALPADSAIERGLLRHNTRNVAVRIRTAAGATVERMLCNRSEEQPCIQLREGLAMALTLEPDLGAIIARLAGHDRIAREDVIQAADGLRRLRITRTDALAAVSRHVRAGTMLAAFLESLLEAVEAQINELSRTLEQFAAAARREYDAAAAQKNDMLRDRDRAAIGAGLESMRVRLGSGFVSRSGLDREVQRLVALHAPRARRMLARSCVLVEGYSADVTDDKLPDGRTKLTLVVIDGDELLRARNAAASAVTQGDRNAKYVSERVWHDLATGAPMVEVTAAVSAGAETRQVHGTMPLSQLYPRVIETVTCTPKVAALRECCKRLLDPLSMCHVLDLIREHGTLPAALYVVSASQSAGVLFDAKELLQVQSGGAELTSLAYFRLYWRLGHDAQGMCTVPGAFQAANCALPLAPEPLTSTVLSTMLSCLMTEFVTGTPLAPLTAAGNLYIGFLLMHMRQQRHSALDIERIGQLLASLGCWLRNPHIRPGPEEAAALVDSLVTKQAVAPGESPGRFFPARALLYSVLDQRHPINARYSGLVKESLRRALRALLPASTTAGSGSAVSARLQEVQIPLREFLRNLVDKLAGPAALQAEDGIPVAAIETAKAIAACNTDAARVAFLTTVPGRREAVAVALRDLLIDRSARGFPAFAAWTQTQRLLFVWFALTTYPMDELLVIFAAFDAPAAFEAHVARLLKLAENEAFFANVLWSWAEPDRHCSLICGMDGKMAVRTVFAKDATVAEEFLEDIVTQQLCVAFDGLLSMWTWSKSAASSVFGLHECDYDVVRALRAPPRDAAVERLSQTQQALFHAAIEGRNSAYRQYAVTSPSKPEEIRRIARADHFAPPQAIRDLTEKPRISAVSIGSVDHGKSTVLGHLLFKCGLVDQHVLDRYERQSRALGKEGSKFAWILERLREERERGVTIEISTWSMATPHYEMDLIDLPGHRTFVKNMAVGASLADVAMLVVSAAPGEFETGIASGGMTREELLMAYTQGVRQFILVVTKMDSAGYSQDRFREIVSNIEVLLQRNSINPKTVPAVPVSGLDGGNLTEPDVTHLSWFEGWTKTLKSGEVVRGRTLLEAIDATELPPRNTTGLLRIPIIRSHKIAGVGTVALGRIISGTLLPSQKVVLLPAGIETTAATIELYHHRRTSATAGELIGFTCRGAAVDDVSRGLVACPVDDPVTGARLHSFIAQVIVVHHPGMITAGYTPYFHAHTGSWAGRFSALLAKIDKSTGVRIEESPPSIKNGDAALVEITPLGRVFLEPYKAQPHLGRFAVRDGGVIVAVGIVVSVNTTSPAAAPSVTRGSRFFHGHRGGRGGKR